MQHNGNEQRGRGTRPNKVVSAAEAVRLIHDGDTVATGGFVGIGFAEEIAVALQPAAGIELPSLVSGQCSLGAR